jgi:hypothetical protein
LVGLPFENIVVGLIVGVPVLYALAATVASFAALGIVTVGVGLLLYPDAVRLSTVTIGFIWSAPLNSIAPRTTEELFVHDARRILFPETGATNLQI